MRTRRQFTKRVKSQVVLKFRCGQKRMAEVCWEIARNIELEGRVGCGQKRQIGMTL